MPSPSSSGGSRGASTRAVLIGVVVGSRDDDAGAQAVNAASSSAEYVRAVTPLVYATLD